MAATTAETALVDAAAEARAVAMEVPTSVGTRAAATAVGTRAAATAVGARAAATAVARVAVARDSGSEGE